MFDPLKTEPRKAGRLLHHDRVSIVAMDDAGRALIRFSKLHDDFDFPHPAVPAPDSTRNQSERAQARLATHVARNPFKLPVSRNVPADLRKPANTSCTTSSASALSASSAVASVTSSTLRRSYISRSASGRPRFNCQTNRRSSSMQPFSLTRTRCLHSTHTTIRANFLVWTIGARACWRRVQQPVGCWLCL